jgi:hypothetical protein
LCCNHFYELHGKEDTSNYQYIKRQRNVLTGKRGRKKERKIEERRKERKENGIH